MSLRPIIVKKIKKVSGGHHGGAWKVAYADFVTAMMAFFLLMWLLNATTEEQRAGLADYFDPKIPISQSSSGGTNVFNGDSVFAQNKLARNGLGGSGKDSAIGKDTNQQHETSSTDQDVWSKGQKNVEFVGNERKTFEAEKKTEAKSDTNSNTMKSKDIEKSIKEGLKKLGHGSLAQHLNFKMTDEGLRIDITDSDKSPMFETGSDVPTAKMKKIINVIGNVLSLLKNNIAITGHTDSSPITGKRNYSNWELSTERANASRRELINIGFEENRIKRIEGRADTQPFIKDKPDDLQNRRVGIVILHDNSLKAMKKEHLKNYKKELTTKANKEKERLKKIDNRFLDIGKKDRKGKDVFIPDPLSFR